MNEALGFQPLQSGQGGIQEALVSLQTTLIRLERELEPMIEGWTGAAQEAYLVNRQQWHQGTEALAQVLQNVARAVGDAHENYRATDVVTKSIWA
ncbi:MAG TPA: WXG100 family type VII secretion target [Jatrophihabitans sp.]|jgi:early secretory antigenic target protein ESAT-6